MTKQEMDRRFDEIVDFAEVESFLDTPVKRYSSGMSVRLGFAVAAHLEPDILIVDEVLAVGDAAFQKKCLAKMGDVSGEGRTILFVSHNMPAVETLCGTGLLLDHGRVEAEGGAREVVEEYSERVASLQTVPLRDRVDRQGDGRLRIQAVQSMLRTGTDSEIRLSYGAAEHLSQVDIAVGLFGSRGEGAAHLATESVGESLELPSGRGTITCRLPRLPLLPGTYSLNVYCTVNGTIADWVTDAATVEVLPGDFFGTGRLPPLGYGSVAVAHSWATEC